MQLEHPVVSEHEKMLRKCLGIDANNALPDKVLEVYDGVRAACRKCGIGMTEAQVVLVAALAGALPPVKAVSFLDIADQYKDGDYVAVRFRGEWRFASYHHVNTTKKKVVATVLDEGGQKREFAPTSVRPLTPQEQELVRE